LKLKFISKGDLLGMDSIFKDILYNLINKMQLQHMRFGKTRLIKLLYLIEIEFFRLKNERLTKVDWIYFKYGPYVMNYDEYFQSRSLDLTMNDDDSDYFNVKIKDHFNIPQLPREVDHLADRLISKFGQNSLNDLLEYVYFETEPMMNVQERGEDLDFSVVLPKEYYEIKKLKISNKTYQELAKKYSEKVKYASKL
jgi:hypothetical protein